MYYSSNYVNFQKENKNINNNIVTTKPTIKKEADKERALKHKPCASTPPLS